MTVAPRAPSADRAGDADSSERSREHRDREPEPPRFARGSDGRLIGGVASGLATYFGIQPLTVRIAFCVLSGISGFGVVLYAALWIFTPSADDVARQEENASPAGIAAASRAGRRWRSAGHPLSARRGDLGQLAAILLLGLGAFLILGQTPLGLRAEVAFPLLLTAVGLALVWRGIEHDERRATAHPERAPWLTAITEGGGWLAVLRLGAGVVIVVLGVGVFLMGQGQLAAMLDALAGIVVLLVGLGLIIGPWLWKLWRTADAERRERIVSQERADMAAHLHDSVLQTLALIQKQAHDPRAVVSLARRQERDLRSWLYGDQSGDEESSLAAALSTTGTEVEEDFGVPVEVVTVGDAPLDDLGRAIIQAAREAAVNAAKHSGAQKIDIYLEATEDGIDVFVRDRGSGFDPEQIPDDRLGVRHSIIDRMRRHGGSAQIRSEPDVGTEVRLTTMP
ncbi:ATP-binding protein [Actinobacteria bacterium YIM 96077]|uniref:ATPase n=1 Tax=Phytoactinopolyspora halophila TaxID=1981511 RepID=A0A329QGD0_9ACTN|nr:ATP-binding protein [Phytoactinopolyspora halophila]AYY14434.1 ATP-binding protein [Actinobacteria bacterium YIM 96077]RAW11427.1 ATPase [Phytoactinopolyspora halophila]